MFVRAATSRRVPCCPLPALLQRTPRNICMDPGLTLTVTKPRMKHQQNTRFIVSQNIAKSSQSRERRCFTKAHPVHDHRVSNPEKLPGSPWCGLTAGRRHTRTSVGHSIAGADDECYATDAAYFFSETRRSTSSTHRPKPDFEKN